MARVTFPLSCLTEYLNFLFPERLRQVATLQEVYETYQNLNLGGKGGVSETFVPGDGPVPSKVMIIGEAPGAEEDEAGKPFVGQSGAILNSLLGHISFQRELVFITNVFKYRPPDNRDPTPQEILKSVPCLTEEIKLVNPKLIIPLGRIAINCFFPTATVRKVRGQKIQRGNRIILCTYHPGIMLHPNKGIRRFLLQDFAMIGEILNEEGLR